MPAQTETAKPKKGLGTPNGYVSDLVIGSLAGCLIETIETLGA